MLKKVRKMWRRLFGNGTKDVREQQLQELQLKALATLRANQFFVRSEVAEEEEYRTPWDVLEDEITVERNPLELLLPEMWAAVFERLEDWEDLKSCYDTCELFRGLLGYTKNKWLFAGVLPLISEHLEQSGTKAVLKCRQICKQWKQEVDKSPNRCHFFIFEVSNDGRARTQQKVRDMVNHRKNPFVGQKLVIARTHHANFRDLIENLEADRERFYERLEEPDIEEEDGGAEALDILADHEDNWREVDQDHVAAVEDINYFLNGLGKYITSIYFQLTLDLTKASAICHLVLCMLSKCQSLVILEICGSGLTVNLVELDPLSEPEIDALTPQDFSLAPNFEVLLVTVLRGFLSIQHRMLQLCAPDIRQLTVWDWAPLAPNLEMSALEVLEIQHHFSLWEQPDRLSIHEDLMQLRAPMLRKLAFSLDENCSLQQLLTLTSRFSSLQHLILYWIGSFKGFSADQLLAVPEGLTPPNSLKTLQFPISKGMNCDFLVFFPLLETLRLCFREEDEDTEHVHIVQVSGYWMKRIKVYESNVWQLFPLLKAVNVSNYIRESYDDTDDYIYTRENYNAYKSQGLSAPIKIN